MRVAPRISRVSARFIGPLVRQLPLERFEAVTVGEFRFPPALRRSTELSSKFTAKESKGLLEIRRCRSAVRYATKRLV